MAVRAVLKNVGSGVAQAWPLSSHLHLLPRDLTWASYSPLWAFVVLPVDERNPKAAPKVVRIK